MTLDQFIEKTYEETIHELIEEIAEAVHRLSFLLDHANLPGTENLCSCLVPPELRPKMCVLMLE